MKIQRRSQGESLPQESKRRDAMEKKKLSKAQALEMALTEMCFNQQTNCTPRNLMDKRLTY